MLADNEFKLASELYHKGFNRLNVNREERFKELLSYYYEVTSFKETEPNAIMHHALCLIGPDCEKCGKPYRTPKAKLCMFCGNERS